MSRKKIVALIASALIAVCVVGGSLAYFSSQDMEENKFATAGTDDGDGSDIEIVEDFPDPGKITPGTTSIKSVQVQNTDDYDQLIKVHFQVNFLDENGRPLMTEDSENPEGKIPVTSIQNNGKTITIDDLKNNLELGMANQYDGTTQEGKWYKKEANTPNIEAEYYYLNAVPGGLYTTKILDSVKLSLNAGNEYQGVKYEVVVVADGIQASNGAYKTAWAPDETLDALLETAANTPLEVQADPYINVAQLIKNAEGKTAEEKAAEKDSVKSALDALADSSEKTALTNEFNRVFA